MAALLITSVLLYAVLDSSEPQILARYSLQLAGSVVHSKAVESPRNNILSPNKRYPGMPGPWFLEFCPQFPIHSSTHSLEGSKTNYCSSPTGATAVMTIDGEIRGGYKSSVYSSSAEMFTRPLTVHSFQKSTEICLQ